MKVSSNEMLMNRLTRTRILISDNILIPKIIPDIYNKLVEQKQKIKRYSYYDRSSRERSDLQEGDNIVYRNGKFWEPGLIIQHDSL